MPWRRSVDWRQCCLEHITRTGNAVEPVLFGTHTRTGSAVEPVLFGTHHALTFEWCLRRRLLCPRPLIMGFLTFGLVSGPRSQPFLSIPGASPPSDRSLRQARLGLTRKSLTFDFWSKIYSRYCKCSPPCPRRKLYQVVLRMILSCRITKRGSEINAAKKIQGFACC